MLRDIDGRATVHAADRQPLHHAQPDQNPRCGSADLLIGGQQPYAERRRSHQCERDEKGVLSSEQIAEESKDDRAERPYRKTSCECEQRQDTCRRLVDTREEIAADDDCQSAIQKKIEPLKNRSYRRGRNDLEVLLPYRVAAGRHERFIFGSYHVSCRALR